MKYGTGAYYDTGREWGEVAESFTAETSTTVSFSTESAASASYTPETATTVTYTLE